MKLTAAQWLVVTRAIAEAEPNPIADVPALRNDMRSEDDLRDYVDPRSITLRDVISLKFVASACWLTLAAGLALLGWVIGCRQRRGCVKVAPNGPSSLTADGAGGVEDKS